VQLELLEYRMPYQAGQFRQQGALLGQVVRVLLEQAVREVRALRVLAVLGLLAQPGLLVLLAAFVVAGDVMSPGQNLLAWKLQACWQKTQAYPQKA
jgi:hypothetical protein